MFQLLTGAFIASYLQNKQFRANVDKTINQLIGAGVDALNVKRPSFPRGGDIVDAEESSSDE